METPSKSHKGATKHCCYRTCRSDSRYMDRSDVFFLRFPREVDRCSRWARACCRQNFSVTKDTYICSLHFVGGRGPTDDHPDPIPANATRFEIERLCKKPRRSVNRQLLLSTPPPPTPEPLRLVRPDVVASETLLHLGQHPLLQNPAAVIEKKPKEPQLPKFANKIPSTRPINDQPKNPAAVIETKPKEPQLPEFANKSPSTRPINDQQKIPAVIIIKAPKRVLDEDPTKFSNKRPCTIQIHDQEKEIVTKPKVANASTQTTDTVLTVKEALALKIENNQLKQKLREATSNSTTSSSTTVTTDDFTIEDVQHNEDKMKFYTGLTFLQFTCLWKFLGPSVSMLSRVSSLRKKQGTPSRIPGPRRKLSAMNELFLTLVRLRLGLLNKDLAYRFRISTSTVAEIVNTWIQFMYLQFNRIREPMFATRQKIQKHLPKTFKGFKNVRVILDCTEFFTEAPRNYEQQGNLYSSYKNHCTCKVLIGITPSGAVSFVSDVCEGSISDKEILKKSGLLDKLQPGDLVMVDRGFNVRDLLLEKGADIVIPPFLAGRDKLTPEEASRTRIIAKLRIHVERVIERMKKFKILKKIVPLNTLSTFSQTVFVVGCLVNFHKPIVQ